MFGVMPVPRVHAFIDVSSEHVGTAQSFWSAVTGWPVGHTWNRHPEFVSLEPPNGNPYVHVQRVDGPSGIHLDLEGNPDLDTARLEELGAERQWRGDGWQVLTSRLGLWFCVCGLPWSYARPGVVAWPDGHHSRLVQLSIDVPAPAYDRECAFWRAATGWAVEAPLRAPECLRLVHRGDSPLQLLVQRLDNDDPARYARAHLDLSTDDLAVEVSRVEGLGARKLWNHDLGFVALQDPIGLPFCVAADDAGR